MSVFSDSFFSSDLYDTTTDGLNFDSLITSQDPMMAKIKDEHSCGLAPHFPPPHYPMPISSLELSSISTDASQDIHLHRLHEHPHHNYHHYHHHAPSQVTTTPRTDHSTSPYPSDESDGSEQDFADTIKSEASISLLRPQSTIVYAHPVVKSTPKTFEKLQQQLSRSKDCMIDGCARRAQSRLLCKAHGGGARCQYMDCTKSSQGGGFCRSHGGGKKCKVFGCMKGTQRAGLCYQHGGIRRCIQEGCQKKDRGNGYCISHGGGKRCELEDCNRAVRKNNRCRAHMIKDM